MTLLWHFFPLKTVAIDTYRGSLFSLMVIPLSLSILFYFTYCWPYRLLLSFCYYKQCCKKICLSSDTCANISVGQIPENNAYHLDLSCFPHLMISGDHYNSMNLSSLHRASCSSNIRICKPLLIKKKSQLMHANFCSVLWCTTQRWSGKRGV